MRKKNLEQESAQDLAGLQIDQLQKLRHGNMTLEQLKWFNNLSFDEREKIMGKQMSSENSSKMKLLYLGSKIPELTEEFDPSNFTKNSKVKYAVNSNFDKYVLGVAKKVSGLPAIFLDKHKFIKFVTDEEIMEYFHINKSSSLMTPEEILYVIWYFTRRQPKGEEGSIMIKGSTIIGYILCGDGVIRPVDISWCRGELKWYCSCREPGLWSSGSEMFSYS
jgi:hypothetical protein